MTTHFVRAIIPMDLPLDGDHDAAAALIADSLNDHIRDLAAAQGTWNVSDNMSIELIAVVQP